MKIFFIFKRKKKSVWYQLIIMITGNINSRISILYVSDNCYIGFSSIFYIMRLIFGGYQIYNT